MEKVTGVYWSKQDNKWTAQIQVDKKKHHLGYFDNHSDAVNARKDAEKKYRIKRNRDTTDLEGQKFGSLTVIGDTGKRYNGLNKILLCRHDDGRILEVSRGSLLNSKNPGNGVSKPIGISGERYIKFNKKNTKYYVQKRINGKLEYFGTFDTLEQAIAKRDEILQLIEQGKL